MRIVPISAMAVLLIGCGRDAVRISPPLVITKEQATFAAEAIREVCREMRVA